MARDTTPNFEPHLASRKEGDLVLWWVRMKTALGEYVSLTEENHNKTIVAREMRKIRQEMAKVWLESRRMP